MVQTIPGNRIYHYCTLKKALKFILPEKRLLLNPIVKTNDPRENKSFIFGAKFSGSHSIDLFDQQRNNEINKILRGDCKVLCFTKENKNNESIWGYELSRMWAHYGDGHKGVCIELDRKEFINENKHIIDKSYFRNVKYWKFDKNVPLEDRFINHDVMDTIGKKTYLKEDFRTEHLDYLFFTKNNEWKSEQEIRLIYFSSNKKKEYCSIQSSIRNIFLGIDFDQSNLPALKILCPDVEITALEFRQFKIMPKLL